MVGKTQPLHHVVHDERLHAVVAEALPHLDEEDGTERAGLGGGRSSHGHKGFRMRFRTVGDAATHPPCNPE
jgi:hypothetical protein